MAVYEIPLQPAQAQEFPIPIAGTTYQLRFTFRDALQGGWIVDFSDVLGNLILYGVPLVTGADLLAQYAYLNFGFKMFVVSDDLHAAYPTWDNLGVSSHLYVEY